MGIVKAMKDKTSAAVVSTIIDQAVKYVQKDPQKNFEKLVKNLGKLENLFASSDGQFSKFLGWINNNPGSKQWFIELLSREENQVRSFMKNLFVNISLGWMENNERLLDQYGFTAPYTILISPTMRCNLQCQGCYAGEYARDGELSADELRRVIHEAKEIGTFFFTILGGEPFVRFWELADIFEENSDCLFQIFTNGTLITDEVADRLKELKNCVIAFSVNGDEKETEFMRGPGVYQKVLASMSKMKERNLLFGVSLVLTKHNFKLMTDPDFYLGWRERGVIYAWNFLFMPVGKDATTELMPSPEQRYAYGEFIQKFRVEQPFYIMDFWADAPFAHGCIAGGRRYMHVNHKGDVEPCVFCHFATDNIREKSLTKCLQSPFLADIRMHQPHTDNLLRPCMIIDNPEVLRDAVARNHARPTHPGAEVILTTLAPSLDEYSRHAAEYLDPIWEERWQKYIKDIEKRNTSYGEGLDRMQYRLDPEKFEERLANLKKNDPEFASLLQEMAKNAADDYGKDPVRQQKLIGEVEVR